MPDSPDPVPPEDAFRATLDEAAGWLLELEHAPADTDLQRRFERWLGADPRHAQAWERVCRAWTRIGKHPAAAAGHRAREAGPSGVRPALPEAEYPRPAPPAGPRHMPRRAAVALAGLAIAACIMVLLAPGVLLRLEADHMTGSGETGQITLADGSRVHLAPQSAIALDYSASRRAVALLRGEAFFDVAPAAGRPFSVEAGGLAVTVVGTAFDLRLDDTRVSVDVQEGRVHVRYDGGAAPLDTRLGAGDRLTVARATGAARRSAVSPASVAAWRDGRLFVDGATVAEVVDRIRPYQSGWIVIAGSGLGGRKVTGLYDLHDPDNALRALVEAHGGVVREVTPLLHVLSLE